MKKSSWQIFIGFLVCCILTATSTLLPAQTSPASGQSQSKSAPPSNGWFTARLVAEKVWCIDDHGSDNMYLVEGQEKALLVDTGLGVANLAEFIKTLTPLPITVINTHGHPDHAGGNLQFEKVYAHSNDFELIKRFSSKEQRENTVKNMLKNATVPDSVILKDPGNLKPTVLMPLKQGDVLDLGKRKLEVIEVPGHTKGSICLLDRGRKLLFTGDNDNTLVWLFLADCTPLETYLVSLQKLNQQASAFDLLLPGHGGPLDKAFIGEQISCVHSILDGSCTGKPYNSFAGKGLVCGYKRAQVAYNPQNLRAQP
jgi:hydroxyacylglutathione hydrolase